MPHAWNLQDAHGYPLSNTSVDKFSYTGTMQDMHGCRYAVVKMLWWFFKYIYFYDSGCKLRIGLCRIQLDDLKVLSTTRVTNTSTTVNRDTGPHEVTTQAYSII